MINYVTHWPEKPHSFSWQHSQNFANGTNGGHAQGCNHGSKVGDLGAEGVKSEIPKTSR